MEVSRPIILEHKDAFIDALEHIEVSTHSKEVLARTAFVALMGLAGGGRNTIIRILTEHYNYIFTISDTTRPPKMRDGRMEQNGIDYNFRSEIGMLGDIQNGDFIEAELIHDQQVSGTSIREVERCAATGKILIHDFEFGGAEALIKAKPDATVIGLLPPSFDEWIRRFRNREDVSDEEFINRLRTAKVVLEQMLTRPYIKLVINDDIDQCVNDIRAIVEAGNYTDQTGKERKAIAEEMLRHVDDMLRTA